MDHWTPTKLRDMLVTHGREASLAKLLMKSVSLAHERGVGSETIQVVDSAQPVADVNMLEDERRQERRQKAPR